MTQATKHGRASSGSISFQIRFDRLKKHLPRNQNVLEIGCGNGLVTRHLLADQNRVVAIDSDLSTVNQLKHHLPTARIIHSNLKDFQTTQKFEVIVCTEVIEHIQNDISALKKIYTLLQPNGLLILSVPLAPYQTRYLKTLGHYRHYSKPQLRTLFSKTKFHIDKSISWGSIFRYFSIFILDRYHFHRRNSQKQNSLNQQNQILNLFKHFIILLDKLTPWFYTDIIILAHNKS